MPRKKYSLMASLLSIINENETDSSSYALAMYLLKNFAKLEKLSIEDTVEANFVSTSGVRRFCRSIGYNNFSNMKEDAYEWEYQFKKYIDSAEKFNDRQKIKEIANNIFQETDENVDEKMIDHLVDLIRTSTNVVFLASEFSVITIKEFQQSLVTFGKIVKIVSSSYVNEEVITSLKENDLLISISITGVYALNNADVVDKANCHKVLITSCDYDALSKQYDEVIRFNIGNDAVDSRIFSKYGIGYLLDLIFMQYVKRWKENKECS